MRERPSGRQYLFGDCLLDTERQGLRRAGIQVALEPKTYAVLLYLLQHRDRLVTRQELLEQVWPEVYVDTSAVAIRIGALRQAIGDTPQAQQMIQTRRGYGYRFIAEVTEQALPGNSSLKPEMSTDLLTTPPVSLSLSHDALTRRHLLPLQ